MILGVMNITENYNFAGHTRGYERYARVDFVQPRSQSWERGWISWHHLGEIAKGNSLSETRVLFQLVYSSYRQQTTCIPNTYVLLTTVKFKQK